MKIITCVTLIVVSILYPVSVYAAVEHEVDKQQCRLNRSGNSSKSAGDLKGPCRACLEEKNAQAAAENAKLQASARAAREAEEKALREKVAKDEAARVANKPGEVSLAFPQQSLPSASDSVNPSAPNGMIFIWAVVQPRTSGNRIPYRFYTPLYLVDASASFGLQREIDDELRRVAIVAAQGIVTKDSLGDLGGPIDRGDVYVFQDAGKKAWFDTYVASREESMKEKMNGSVKVYILDELKLKYATKGGGGGASSQ